LCCQLRSFLALFFSLFCPSLTRQRTVATGQARPTMQQTPIDWLTEWLSEWVRGKVLAGRTRQATDMNTGRAGSANSRCIVQCHTPTKRRTNERMNGHVPFVRCVCEWPWVSNCCLILSLLFFQVPILSTFHLVWADCLFSSFYVFRAVFGTIVVSLSSPLYVIDILCFCAFWTNK